MPDAMELRISRALDGTETSLDRITGAVVTREVPRDHIPIHGYTVTPRAQGKRQQYHQWTPEEDARLIELRMWGLSKRACARALGVTNTSIEARTRTKRDI